VLGGERRRDGSPSGILLNEHIAEDGPTVFAHACQLGAEGIVSKKINGAYQSGPCRVWVKVRNPANRRAAGAGRDLGPAFDQSLSARRPASVMRTTSVTACSWPSLLQF
jgi:hypothetical protein